eukprot:9423383-Pyramimonas_sp.AAC.1
MFPQSQCRLQHPAQGPSPDDAKGGPKVEVCSIKSPFRCTMASLQGSASPDLSSRPASLGRQGKPSRRLVGPCPAAPSSTPHPVA